MRLVIQARSSATIPSRRLEPAHQSHERIPDALLPPGPTRPGSLQLRSWTPVNALRSAPLAADGPGNGEGVGHAPGHYAVGGGAAASDYSAVAGAG